MELILKMSLQDMGTAMETQHQYRKMNLIFLGSCWPSHQKCWSGTPSGDSAWVSASADVSLMNEKLYNRNLHLNYFDLLTDQHDFHTSNMLKRGDMNNPTGSKQP